LREPYEFAAANPVFFIFYINNLTHIDICQYLDSLESFLSSFEIVYIY
jgi:hypothetical protein